MKENDINSDHIEVTSQDLFRQGAHALAGESSRNDPVPVSSSPSSGVQIPQRYKIDGVRSEFSSTNFTSLPDAYLATWRPTALIRHPALVFPSSQRAMHSLKAGGFMEPEMVEPIPELHPMQ
ncbi:uncharacterized protein BP01DRAFT_384032 [Aspergillus saccharolyticus JOP 1030-1]|uniref:Uncharacterized protein n=1 Tax=Aspergillus saccharolyticus JOP 1030-1 TaxID=1450539 RepID=A0A318Z9C1_9EURO|nr:hypothetical protein BP01DRAFT_384032 [Aspergillus saccharolyticus JOP 1030-1]PYH43926.1 hypothetical protein BP01DRAFT_384032 [Aspergillus saccharolyticus JOP 1030-1]